MASEDQILAQMAANEQLYADGKLSYPAMCAKNEALQAQIQRSCNHSNTEKEDLGDGDYILWCAKDTCSVMVQKHVKDKAKAASVGTPGKTKKRSRGCVVLGVLLVGAVSALGLGAAEVIRMIL